MFFIRILICTCVYLTNAYNVNLNKNVNHAASCMRGNGERDAGSGVSFKMPPLDESFLNSEIRDSRRRWTKRP